MVNIVRNKGNWEAKFTNITYEQAKEIEGNSNISEISIYHKVGVASIPNEFMVEVDVRAYDKNAIKNARLNLIDGRLPENSNEIVIQKCDNMELLGIPNKINEKIKLTIGGKEREYIVVGMAEKIDFNIKSIGYYKIAAITYLDKELNMNSQVNATVLTKNIQKIYQTINIVIANMNHNSIIEKRDKYEGLTDEEKEKKQMLELLGVTDDKDEKSTTIEYNKELLNYECVIEADTEFIKTLLVISIASIIIIMLVSIIVIYTSFKMSCTERMNEYGMLASIGMNAKQRKNIIRKESLILGGISIPVGIIIGIEASQIIISVLDKLVRTAVYEINPLKY